MIMNLNGMTLPYKEILKRFWSKSDMGRIKISEARKTLSWFFRMGKNNSKQILKEMKNLGYIRYNGNKYGIEIVPHIKDLV